jgi:hypothetical protein
MYVYPGDKMSNGKTTQFGLDTRGSNIRNALVAPNLEYSRIPHGEYFRKFMRGFLNPRSRAVFSPMFSFGAESVKVGAPFSGGVLAPNGNVIFVPRASPYIGIYNPVTDTYTNGPMHGKSVDNAFNGGVLTPNGKVVFVPIGSPSGVYSTRVGILHLCGLDIGLGYCLHPYLNKF